MITARKLTALDPAELTAAVARMPGVDYLVHVSSDGLAADWSDGTTKPAAERWAAVVAGMTSLATASSMILNGTNPPHLDYIPLMFSTHLVMVIVCHDQSMLAAIAAADADTDVIGRELGLLSQKPGRVPAH